MNNRIDIDTYVISELVDKTVEFAETAALRIRSRRSELGDRGLQAGMKTKSSDVDPVTEVDLESEQLIRGLIADYRPQDFILGEEGGRSRVDDSVAHSDEPSLEWIVDPIDGTVNFLYALPAYAVSIAVRDEAGVIAGAVADVPGQRVFFAGRGFGSKVKDAQGNIRDITASAPKNIAQSLVATGFGYDANLRAQQGTVVAQLLSQCRDIRRIGSAAMDLCLLAQGSIDAYYERGIKVWDYAAGSLIAEEAGAIFTELTPNENYPDAGGAIAVASNVSDEFHNLLRGYGVL